MHYRYFTIEQRETLAGLLRARLTDDERPAALERLRSPEFGVCERCSDAIPFARLLVEPTRRRCDGCEGP